MILRNVSKYCRPLTSVCEAQSNSDSERFAFLTVCFTGTCSLYTISCERKLTLHGVITRSANFFTAARLFCFRRWNKIPNYKIMSLFLKCTLTKNVFKKMRCT